MATSSTSKAVLMSRKRRCFPSLQTVNPAEIATHYDLCECKKSVLQSGSFKVFQKFYVAAISVQKNQQSCVISLTQMSRQEAQTVVQSCG
jgi:hypothetical protein